MSAAIASSSSAVGSSATSELSLAGLVDGHVDAELCDRVLTVGRLVELVVAVPVEHPVLVAATLATLENAGYQ